MLAKGFSGINRKWKGSKMVNINAKFVGQRFKLGRNLTKTDRTKRKKYLKFFFNLINKTNSKCMVTIKFHGFVI